MSDEHRMDMDGADSQLPSLSVRFPGPFEHHDVVVEGWRVPFLQAHLRGEDRIMLVLDERMGLELSTAEAERLVPFLADAISVALGYGAHPRGEMPTPLERAPYPRPERVVDVALARATPSEG
jgi:hypothetical protein